jgi:hypothetical protein
MVMIVEEEGEEEDNGRPEEGKGPIDMKESKAMRL